MWLCSLSAAGRTIVAKRTVLAKSPSENWLTWPQKLAVICALSLEPSRMRSLTTGNVAHFGDVTIVSVSDLLAEQRGFELPIYLCPETLAMSNSIAPVSLDFDSTGSMCRIGKGVGADGRALSRGNG
jgi:hypothetical protein